MDKMDIAGHKLQIEIKTRDMKSGVVAKIMLRDKYSHFHCDIFVFVVAGDRMQNGMKMRVMMIKIMC